MPPSVEDEGCWAGLDLSRPYAHQTLGHRSILTKRSSRLSDQAPHDRHCVRQPQLCVALDSGLVQGLEGRCLRGVDDLLANL